MAFRIRKIEYTADGRRIVRDTDIAGETLGIGRASDNAIALPDLAVEPHHALITLIAPGTASGIAPDTAPRKLSMRALGTLGFTVDGRVVHEASLDAVSGAELGFGSFRLGVSRDSDGTVLISVEDATPARELLDTAQDKHGFTLASVMPGKRPMAWALALVILLAFLALPVITHLATLRPPATHTTTLQATPQKTSGAVINDASWNPGPLSLAHQSLTNRCESCHVRPFESVRNETCQSCHKDTHDHAAAIRLATARGGPALGQALRQSVAHAFGREGSGACVDCHVEHTGNRPMDPPRQQFCADCHASLTARLADTRLGNAGDFGTSHPQFRARIITDAESRKTALVSLDAHPREDNGLTFSHKVHLDPLGGVAKMAMTLGANGYGKALDCANCHQKNADGVSFQPISMERNCEACHSLAYGRVGTTVLKLRHGDVAQMAVDLSRGTGVQPLANTRTRPGARPDARPDTYAPGGPYYAGFTQPFTGDIAAKALSRGGICGECHTPVMRGGQWGVRHVSTVARYLPNGWFDHNAHRQTACADCHAAKQSQSAGDVLLPGVKQCRDCHLGESAAPPKWHRAAPCAMPITPAR